MNSKALTCIFFSLVLLFGRAPSACAQGTAFTYQGRLNNGASPASGIYDLQFAIYDSTNTPGVLLAGPLTNAATAVSNGLFMVTLDFGAGIFTGDNRWLEIGVRTNGGGPFTTLTPRQPLTPSPYAIFAGGVNAAGISGTIPAASIGNGTISSNMLATGAVGASQLAAGAAAANLHASGQSTVPSGGMILSSNSNDASLMSAGYIKLGKVDLGDIWDQPALTSPASPRRHHTAVWTGSEMIVWGGNGGSEDEKDSFDLADGGRYNPALNVWTPMTLSNAPAARIHHSAIWTGTEMIVYGGYIYTGVVTTTQGDGGRYNPATDTWVSLPSGGGNRYLHTAIWTGSEMILWGGFNRYGGDYAGIIPLLTGARYNPATNTWTTMATNVAPTARGIHTAVWTGTEMVIWGGTTTNGNGNAIYLNDGARYNPSTDTWTAVTTNSAPAARDKHTAVWTGSAMIIWGGVGASYFNDGGRYNPGSNAWTALNTNGAPAMRVDETAVWTGSQMVVWGGENNNLVPLNDGGRYNSVSDSWAPVNISGAPSPRGLHTAVWTGNEMIVWGGGDVGNGNAGYENNLGDGGRYNPSTDSWLAGTAMSVVSAPEPRILHTAVWTGTEMVVWGGYGPGGYLDVGGRYNPALNSWGMVSGFNAPFPRRANHTAVWTGSEMIVWGGTSGNNLNLGGRYNPAANSWTATTLVGAPVGRSSHTAVWTGNEMIVWGGLGNVTSVLNDGGRYNPSSDSWTPTTAVGTPAARYVHTAVWTGNQMIVWGGNSVTSTLNDGGRYNPTTDAWIALTTNSTPTARAYHTAVWTGSQMIVWGGQDNSGNPLNDGGRYILMNDTWTAVTTNGAPAARANHTAIWTGSEMIVWGGGGASIWNDGGRYDPGANGWTAVSTVGAPAARGGHTAVWTGNGMIVWGGWNVSSYFNDTFTYNPSRVLYLYQRL